MNRSLLVSLLAGFLLLFSACSTLFALGFILPNPALPGKSRVVPTPTPSETPKQISR